jgi:two-component flavin-dependent monooxygenase
MTSLDTPRSREAVAHAARIADRDQDLLEKHRRLTHDVARAVTDAGFSRHFVPRRFGGQAGTFSALLSAATVLGETCAATAWCATLYAAHGRLASYLPEQGQRELWEASPDTRIAAAIMPPSGTASAVPGGWQLTGRWRSASGVDHADWVLLASRTPGREGHEHRLFAVPGHEVAITDTWHTLGMRGTGSNTVEVSGVLVPRHRTCTLTDLLQSLPGAARCHTVPYSMVGALMFALPILGAARGSLAAWTETLAIKQRADGSPAAQAPDTQLALARSAAEIRAAGLLLEQAAYRADHAPVTSLLVAEGQRDAAVAVELCAGAVDRLFRASGTHGQAEGDPVQRRWRDITTAATHVTLSVGPAAAAYANAVFDTADRPADSGPPAEPGAPAGPWHRAEATTGGGRLIL